MKKKIGIISMLLIIVIVIISTILLTNKIRNKQVTTDDTIAYMYEDETGEYEPGSINKWDEGYALNEEQSSCDEEEILSWDNNTNEVLLTTDKPTKCTLYFDKKEYVLLSDYSIEDNDITLTNLVKNGDFENNEENWNLEYDCSIATEQVSHGEHSLKYGNCRITQILDPKPPIINHDYYGRLMLLSNKDFSSSDARYGWHFYGKHDNGDVQGVTDLGFVSLKSSVTNWTLLSGINKRTSNEYSTDEWYLRAFAVNPNFESYVDELMLIDLTESFGETIPKKEDLDKELIYFDGKVDMKKTKGKEGIFKVTNVPNNAPIECNNGGKATVTDGQVTITGGAPITTCYLKKPQ